MGIPKARVFPEPVLDLARTSIPAMASGITSSWTGKGSWISLRDRARMTGALAPSSANVVNLYSFTIGRFRRTDPVLKEERKRSLTGTARCRSLNMSLSGSESGNRGSVDDLAVPDRLLEGHPDRLELGDVDADLGLWLATEEHRDHDPIRSLADLDPVEAEAFPVAPVERHLDRSGVEHRRAVPRLRPDVHQVRLGLQDPWSGRRRRSRSGGRG